MHLCAEIIPDVFAETLKLLGTVIVCLTQKKGRPIWLKFGCYCAIKKTKTKHWQQAENEEYCLEWQANHSLIKFLVDAKFERPEVKI